MSGGHVEHAAGTGGVREADLSGALQDTDDGLGPFSGAGWSAGRADEAGIGLAYGHPDAAQLDDAEAALEGVIAEGNAQTAPLARLRLAALRFSRGRHDLAAADYEALLAESPSPDFAALARIGLAHCAEAAGRFAEAACLFRSFRADLPSSHLANDALLGEARCLILQGTDASRQEARQPARS